MERGWNCCSCEKLDPSSSFPLQKFLSTLDRWEESACSRPTIYLSRFRNYDKIYTIPYKRASWRMTHLSWTGKKMRNYINFARAKKWERRRGGGRWNWKKNQRRKENALFCLSLSSPPLSSAPLPSQTIFSSSSLPPMHLFPNSFFPLLLLLLLFFSFVFKMRVSGESALQPGGGRRGRGGVRRTGMPGRAISKLVFLRRCVLTMTFPAPERPDRATSSK